MKELEVIDSEKLLTLLDEICATDAIYDAVANLPVLRYTEPKQDWIPCSERPPEEIVPVNVTWVNRNPNSCYADIKDEPFTGTAIYCNGKWWWDSAVCEDLLMEYGKSVAPDVVDKDIDIIAWQPLPEPYRGDTK